MWLLTSPFLQCLLLVCRQSYVSVSLTNVSGLEWRLLYRLPRCQSLSTTVLFRITLSQTIILNQLMKWLLGSNLSQSKMSLQITIQHLHFFIWLLKDAVNPIFDRAVNLKTKTYNGFVNKFTNNIGLWAWILREVKGKKQKQHKIFLMHNMVTVVFIIMVE